MPVCQLIKKHVSAMALAGSAAWESDLDIPLQESRCSIFRVFKPNSSIPTLDLPQSGLTFQVFSSIDEASFFWEPLAQNNLFLSPDYLRALEQAPPKGITPYYIVFFKEETPAGIAYIQWIEFRADKSLQWPDTVGTLPRILQGFRKMTARLLRFRLLHLGNALLTGPRAYSFFPEIMEEQEFQAALVAAFPELRKYLRSQGRPADSFVVKDIPERLVSSQWREHGYSELCFLPNMVFTLDPAWRSFDDYLSSLFSKYRVRARRAFRLLDGVKVRELSLREIDLRKEELYHLYQSVAQSVSFNMTTLDPGYFSALKSELGENFRLTGYFLQEKLVGFYTTIENEEELEAHFIGFDPAANREYQLYLNMLFHIIRDGIELGARSISFARTAPEIKSSVGAVPEEFKCYIRHQSPIVNALVRPLIDWLWEKEAWEERHPFK